MSTDPSADRSATEQLATEQFASVGDVTVCYQTFGDPALPTVLLIMGLGFQLVHWPDQSCRTLAGSGFHVVRFDNRDSGRSTHLPGATYTLEDMADDTVGLLDHLEVDSAHLVGASMGGMVAQLVAIRHPGRGFAQDEAEVRRATALAFERDPAGRAGRRRQHRAARSAGDRTAALGRLDVPTVVIHGTADRMCRPSGGLATAAAVPGARLELIDGMGHDLPPGTWPRIIGALVENASFASRRRGPR